MLDKYMQADKELAELLGWTIRKGHPCGLPPNYVGRSWSMPLPRWTQDDAACAALMWEHEVTFRWGLGKWPNKAVFGGCENTLSEIIAQGEEHPDKSTACRFMVVQAIIAKLKGNK